MANFKFIPLLMSVLLIVCGCRPSDDPVIENPDPKGTVYYESTNDLFPNPERGFHIQTYYESDSAGLNDMADPQVIKANRTGKYFVTLYLHSYYLTPYMDGDIAQECLDRLEKNMLALRQGGAKCVLRFAYKYSQKDPEPWDPTPEIVARHIDQLAPYLQEYSDVIFCMQAGFIGIWGEWYYTTHFPMVTDDEYEVRCQMAEHLMEVLPSDRQIGFRYPGLKMRYLRMRALNQQPVDSATSHLGDIRSRWAAHNDCFVSSQNDVGTFHSDEERTFLQADTRFCVNGGETCGECYFSNGKNALEQMALYHWTYINSTYHQGVINSWISGGQMDEIKRRLGYRLVLDKAYWTQNPQADSLFTVQMNLHNEGFAAPVNKRNVELILVKDGEKLVFPQNVDPRYWMGGEKQVVTLSCTLPKEAAGTYSIFLNLPDPYETLHDNPDFSIRLANKNVWEPQTGYNKLGQFTVK